MRVAGMGRPSESRPFGTQIAYAHGVQFVVDRTGLQEVSGATVVVRFRIVDLSNEFGPYRVKVPDCARASLVCVAGTDTRPGGGGGKLRHGNQVLRQERYDQPGLYTVTIPSPNVQVRPPAGPRDRPTRRC